MFGSVFVMFVKIYTMALQSQNFMKPHPALLRVRREKVDMLKNAHTCSCFLSGFMCLVNLRVYKDAYGKVTMERFPFVVYTASEGEEETDAQNSDYL
jgi:hypothetical protein